MAVSAVVTAAGVTVAVAAAAVDVDVDVTMNGVALLSTVTPCVVCAARESHASVERKEDACRMWMRHG